MFERLRNYLNRNAGVIVNVANATFKNDGENVIISIPQESFAEYPKKIVNSSDTTKSELSFDKGEKGFIIKKLVGEDDSIII